MQTCSGDLDDCGLKRISLVTKGGSNQKYVIELPWYSASKSCKKSKGLNFNVT